MLWFSAVLRYCSWGVSQYGFNVWWKYGCKGDQSDYWEVQYFGYFVLFQ